MIETVPGVEEDTTATSVMSDTQRIEEEFERAKEALSDDFAREETNWKLYGGIGLDQYTAEDKYVAALEGRDLSTFNVIQQKVNTLLGYHAKNSYDSHFMGAEQASDVLTEVLNKAYMSDKEMMDWGVSLDQAILGALNFSAWEEMYIDFRFHKLGNIAFRCHMPGHVIRDPRWKSQSGKDMRKLWVVWYKDAEEVKELFPDKAYLVDADIAMVKSNGAQFTDAQNEGVAPKQDTPETTGGQEPYRIIRKFEMVSQEVEIEYDAATGIDLPIGADYAKKLHHLNKTNPAWEPDKIKKRQEKRRVCMVTTVCRRLDQNEPLEKAPSPIQIGRIPLFEVSASNINGVRRGIPDILLSVQRKINYREELITNLIELAAIPPELADPLLFGEDEDKMKTYEQHHNRPGGVHWTEPGAMQRGLMPKYVDRPSTIPETRDQLGRMWDYSDRISGSPAAFDARSEKSGESGYLFAQKVKSGEQGAYPTSSAFRRHESEKAEAYFEQFKIQYNIGGVQRRFPINAGKEEITVNRKYSEVIEGEEMTKIENDISSMPRHKVVITESPSSATNRLINRSLSNELLRTIPPENIGTRQVVNNTLVKTLDTFDSKDRQDLEEMGKLEQEQAELTLKANITKLKLGNLQMEEQLRDMQKQIKQKRAAEASGVPPVSQQNAGALPGQGAPAPNAGMVAPDIAPEQVSGAPQAPAASPSASMDPGANVGYQTQAGEMQQPPPAQPQG